MPDIDLPGWSQIILAAVAVGGAFGAHRLNKRGQETQSKQQFAANNLAERAQGFDEMESLVERLNHEIDRVEARSDRNATAQARRCRTALDLLSASLTTLQGQVDGAAAAAAMRATADAAAHIAEDHPDTPNRDEDHWDAWLPKPSALDDPTEEPPHG